MKRWKVVAAVAAALGVLLYLQLEPQDSTGSSSSAALREEASHDARTQGLGAASRTRGLPSDSSTAVASDGGAEAREEDAADAPGTLSLRGQVLDPQGQPLAGVRVQAAPGDSSFAETHAAGETDAEGRFRLRSLMPGSYDVSFERERFLPLELKEHALSESSVPLAITLQPALLIQGRVVDTTGQPLSGASLHLYKPERSESVGSTQEPVALTYETRTKTDSDGTFILDAPQPGPWLLLAFLDGFSIVERQLSAPAKDVWLVLGAGNSVEVTVVDEKEQPVPHATVGLWQENGRVLLQTRADTDEAGRVLLQGLESGSYHLVAVPPLEQGLRVTTAPLTVRGEKLQRVRLRFEQGPSLSGVVVDRSGRPIPDVKIQVRLAWSQKLEDDPVMKSLEGRLSEERLSAPRVARTGMDGRFTVPHLRQLDYRVSFDKPGYSLGPPPPFEGPLELNERFASPAEGELRVVLAYQGRVSGRVVRATDGEPIRSFQVDGTSFESPDGTFSVTAGDPGPHTLDVLAEDVGGLRQEYEAREGQDVELGDLVLGDGRPVSVRVVDDATGRPLRSVHLELRDTGAVGEASPAALTREGQPEQSDGERLSPIELGLGYGSGTGEDGSLLLPDVPARPLALTATRDGFEPWSGVLGPDERELALRLRSWATVQGQVLAGGEPLSAGRVEVYSLEGSRKYRLEVKKGWYSSHAMPPGPYFFRASCEECPYAFTPQAVQVPGPQETLTLDFQESHGATLEVHSSVELERLYLVPGSQPLPTSATEFRRAAGKSHSSESFDEDRGYRFRNVPAGSYTLVGYFMRENQRVFLRQEVTLPAEGVIPLEFPAK